MSKPIVLQTREGFSVVTEPKKVLEKWQKILRCQDWDIDITIARYSKMDNGDVAGWITREYTKKYAHIHLLDPVDIDKSTYHNGNTFPYDMEQVLVHELLHLGTNYFEPEDKGEGIFRDNLEQFVEQISWALIRLDRRDCEMVDPSLTMKGVGVGGPSLTPDGSATLCSCND